MCKKCTLSICAPLSIIFVPNCSRPSPAGRIGEVVGVDWLLSGFLRLRLREDSILAVDMLVKVWFYERMHRVQNEVDSFSARELCGRNKVTVAGN